MNIGTIFLLACFLSIEVHCLQGHGTSWAQIQNLFWKTWEGNTTLSHVAEMINVLATLTLDFNSPLANQAKRLARAELSGSREHYAKAMFVSLYGDPEDEERRRMKRETNFKFQADWHEEEGILQHLWEILQLEYFLYFYRQKEHLHLRKKRLAPTFAGLLSSIDQIDIELASNIAIGDVGEDGGGGSSREGQGQGQGRGEGEDQGGGDDDVTEVEEEPRYNAYIADVAYFFPIADFYFPFDGTFHLFQTEFSAYDLVWPGDPPNL